ncbi:mRNA-decapping enzyme subunit 2 [Raphanus sativus]|uniref:mRNA-decapping enzyme subunit 2-like n=1 Tax=Raphanus sativus TaxID=3726 RepID=A0A9W3DHM5_RAPSA|nr:mRNA-decapping enzyme subunit 2-like [Raphanus sativus]KAJ4902514.1 mRNA-decapping enzyme subunit 2 [Raphanus sativus]
MSRLPSKKVLDDLYSRFVLNGPEEEKQSLNRLMFLVENAHWYYEDNVVENDQTLKSLSLREFTCLLFNNSDVLRPYAANMDKILSDFFAYKSRVPVAGAIILDETYERCLLVKGWKRSSRWSFPRGKKNTNEEDDVCAIREVLEETGFDVSKMLKKEEYIEFTFEGKKRVRLYIVVGVRDDTAFAPQTKKEISQIAWHRLDGLESGFAGLKLFMVAPFLASLKSWMSSKHLMSPLSIDKPLKPPLCVWSAVTKTRTTTITKTEIRRYNVKPWKQSLKVDKSAILPALGICS